MVPGSAPRQYQKETCTRSGNSKDAKWCAPLPLYQSTGSQYFNFLESAKTLLLAGSAYRIKYHEEPAQLGIVSVSLFAGPLHLGQAALTHSVICAKGDSPVPVGSYFLTYGNSTGKSFSGIGCAPHFSQ